MLAAMLLANLRSCTDQMATFQFGMALQLCRRGLELGNAMLKQLQTLQRELPGISELLNERLPVLQTAILQLPEVEKLLQQLLETPSDF